MDRIRTRFYVAVSGRLASAADTDAKADLVEELGDNLYQRYLDLVDHGMDSESAYGAALQDLGDVDELLAYLEAADAQHSDPDPVDFSDSMERFVTQAKSAAADAVSMAQEAAGIAKAKAQELAAKLKEKAPKTCGGSIHVHYNEDGEVDDRGRSWVWSIGYNKNTGRFYTKSGEDQPSRTKEIAGEAIHSIFVDTEGDLTLISEEGRSSIAVIAGEKDLSQLDIAAEEGILSLRSRPLCEEQPELGRAETDIQLVLPQKFWKSIRLSTASGDIELMEGLSAEELTATTTGGDIFTGGFSGTISAKTTGGDVCCRGLTGKADISTSGGDISLAGAPEHLTCITAGGDIKLHMAELPYALNASSSGGNIKLYLSEEQGFRLNCRIFGGDLKSELPLSKGEGSELLYGDGSHILTLNTTGGDVTIKQR